MDRTSDILKRIDVLYLSCERLPKNEEAKIRVQDGIFSLHVSRKCKEYLKWPGVESDSTVCLKMVIYVGLDKQTWLLMSEQILGLPKIRHSEYSEPSFINLFLKINVSNL